MKREDYLPEDLLPLPPEWLGTPEFRECPNDPDMIHVLSSGGYILFDKDKKRMGEADMSDTCTCDKESSAMKDWVINHTVLSKSEKLRGIIVLNGITCARFKELVREIEAAMENKSFEDGLLILHEVPEVLYIPVGGVNDQVR